MLRAYWRATPPPGGQQQGLNGVELLGVEGIRRWLVDSYKSTGDHKLERSVGIPMVSPDFEQVFADKCASSGEGPHLARF